MLICRSEEEMIERFEDWSAGAEANIGRLNPAWGMPQIEFGVYVIENKDMPFPEMIDRAKLALKETLRQAGSKLRYAFYDDAARSRMFREKQLSDVMEDALNNREFQVYLQMCIRDRSMCLISEIMRSVYGRTFSTSFQSAQNVDSQQVWIPSSLHA